MKKIGLYIIAISWLVGITLSCTTEEPAVEGFDVTTAKTTYKVGETITFNLTGNPGVITFYSGRLGAEYRYRVRTRADSATALFRFTSAAAGGTQSNSLKLLVSTDFNGTYDTTAIKQATWTDITSRGTLSPGATTVSGDINLADFAKADKPAYLAFQYIGNQSSTIAQRNWTITAVTLTNVFPSGKVYNIPFSFAQMGWFPVNVKNTANNWLVGTDLRITGGGINAPANEDWVITRPINLQDVLPDVGIPLKNTSTRLSTYTSSFPAAGKYTITFVGANQTVYGRTEAVKELVLTIE